MSPFENALLEEERWLCVIPEQPFPNDAQAGRRIYVGPCLPPRNSLHYRSEVDAIREPMAAEDQADYS